MENHAPLLPIEHIRAYLNQEAARLPTFYPDTTEVVDCLQQDSPFYGLPVPQQDKLAKFVASITRRIDRDSQDAVFEDTSTVAEALDQASRDALRLMAGGWSSKYAVLLTMRHSAASIEELIDEFSAYPMLTPHRCKTIITQNVSDPRQRLNEAVAYVNAARATYGIWHLSNKAIFRIASQSDIVSGNFEALIQAEEADCAPLDAEPEEALLQLRGRRTGLSDVLRGHKHNVVLISRSIHNTVASDPTAIALCAEMGISTDMLEHFSQTLAAYTEAFDYTASADSERVTALAHHYLREVRSLQKIGIPDDLATKAVFAHDTAYYVDFMANAKEAELGSGAIRALLKNFAADPAFHLNRVIKLSQELEKIDPDMRKKTRLIIARKTVGSDKSPQQIIDDHYANIDTASLLFGKRLSRGFITRCCVNQPVGCLASIGKAHALAEELYITYHDPCMPEGFIQTLVEKTSHKTIRGRLEAYKQAIAELRAADSQVTDEAVWGRVHTRLSPNNT